MFNSLKIIISDFYSFNRLIISFLFIFTFVFALRNLNLSFQLVFSFLLNIFALIVLYFYTIRKKSSLSITNSSTIIFSLAFFIVAPIIQIINSEYNELINTLPIFEIQLLKANFLIFLFLIFYIFFRELLRDKINIFLFFNSNKKYNLNRLLLLNLIIITPFVPINTRELLSFFNGTGSYSYDLYSSILILILTKYIYMLPIFFTALIIYHNQNNNNIFLILFSLLICLFFKNPFIENRSGFGTSFLLLFWIFFKKYLNSNQKILIAFFIVIFIFFPIGEIISLYRTNHISAFDKFFNVFNTVHYDAWSNGVGIIDLVDKSGFQYGEQLLGSLFFWIPRFLWESKPIATGQLLGIFLTEYYHHWMVNISSPIIFEGYIDFGYAGVILFAFFWAFFSDILDKMYSSQNASLFIFSTYIGLSYFFLLRGPLLSSFAYTCGNALAIITGIWLVNNFCLYEDKK